MSCSHLMYIVGRLGTRPLGKWGTRFNTVRLFTTNNTQRIITSRPFPAGLVSERLYQTSNTPIHTQYHKKDSIPDDYVLIYTNSFEKYFKYFVLVVPGGIIIYFYLFKLYIENVLQERDAKKHTFHESAMDKLDQYLYSIIGEFDKRERINKEDVYDDMDMNFAIAAFVVHSILLLGIAFVYRQCIFRIYKHFDYQKYIAIKPRMFIFRKQLTFDIEDVQRKNIKTAAAWCTGNVKIKNRSFLLIPDDFKLPAYYNEMFGFH